MRKKIKVLKHVISDYKNTPYSKLNKLVGIGEVKVVQYDRKSYLAALEAYLHCDEIWIRVSVSRNLPILRRFSHAGYFAIAKTGSVRDLEGYDFEVNNSA